MKLRVANFTSLKSISTASSPLFSINNYKSCARILDLKSGERMAAISIFFMLFNVINKGSGGRLTFPIGRRAKPSTNPVSFCHLFFEFSRPFGNERTSSSSPSIYDEYHNVSFLLLRKYPKSQGY